MIAFTDALQNFQLHPNYVHYLRKLKPHKTAHFEVDCHSILMLKCMNVELKVPMSVDTESVKIHQEITEVIVQNKVTPFHSDADKTFYSRPRHYFFLSSRRLDS